MTGEGSARVSSPPRNPPETLVVGLGDDQRGVEWRRMS